jgi:thymidine kinase
MSSQLVFRYSTMNAGKSMEIIRVAYNYKERNKKVLLFTAAVDNRYGEGKITSRTGLSVNAHIIDDNVYEFVKKELPDVVIADESQFFSDYIINELARVVDELHIPVLCYGLRTDFRGKLFEGSKRLFELADKIEEIKTMCWFSDKKATMNIRVNNGKPVFEGEQVQIGGNESYFPVCRQVYRKIKNGEMKLDERG